MLDVKPFFTRLIVKPLGVPEKIGSIIIPQTSKEMEATEGIVLAVGPEVEACVVGDHVYYGRYSGMKFERSGNKFELINEKDLLGLVEEVSNG